MAELFEGALASRLVGALLVVDQLAHYVARKDEFSLQVCGHITYGGEVLKDSWIGRLELIGEEWIRDLFCPTWTGNIHLGVVPNASRKPAIL